jgi:hypothetical protein
MFSIDAISFPSQAVTEWQTASAHSDFAETAPYMESVEDEPLPTKDIAYSTAGQTQHIKVTLFISGKKKVEDFVSEDGDIRQLTANDDSDAEVISLPEKLEMIKQNFGIGTKHLACALKVERPTVYGWMSGSVPQEKRRERIEALATLAQYWKSISKSSLNARVFDRVEDNRTVLDLLSDDAIGPNEIKSVLKKLAEESNSRIERLRANAEAMRDRMKAKGIKPLSEDIVDQSFRDLSSGVSQS